VAALPTQFPIGKIDQSLVETFQGNNHVTTPLKRTPQHVSYRMYQYGCLMND